MSVEYAFTSGRPMTNPATLHGGLGARRRTSWRLSCSWMTTHIIRREERAMTFRNRMSEVASEDPAPPRSGCCSRATPNFKEVEPAALDHVVGGANRSLPLYGRLTGGEGAPYGHSYALLSQGMGTDQTY